MKAGTEITYNHFRIYLNSWGEYCVCRKLTSEMVSYNAGFKTLRLAQIFINKINPKEHSKEDIEKIATRIKVLYD